MALLVEAIEFGNRSRPQSGDEIRQDALQAYREQRIGGETLGEMLGQAAIADSSSLLSRVVASPGAPSRRLVSPEEWMSAHGGAFPDLEAVAYLVGPRSLSGMDALYADFLNMVRVPVDLSQAKSAGSAKAA